MIFNLDAKGKPFILGILPTLVGFYFIYLTLRVDLAGQISHISSLIFALILFYFGGRFLYKVWKNEKIESPEIKVSKLRRMIAIGIAIFWLIFFILHSQSKL